MLMRRPGVHEEKNCARSVGLFNVGRAAGINRFFELALIQGHLYAGKPTLLVDGVAAYEQSAFGNPGGRVTRRWPPAGRTRVPIAAPIAAAPRLSQLPQQPAETQEGTAPR